MNRIVPVLVLLAASALAQAQSPMRVQYAEPVSVPTSSGNVSFDAYGRRFDLELTNNDRVTSKFSPQRKAELASYRILRGTLTGRAHSWVRLTEFNGRTEGAIWDGQDLYAVTSLDRISPNLSTPISGAPKQTVVYRLSDTINAFPKNFCADAAPLPKAQANNGLAQYRAMVAELATRAAGSGDIPLQIEISLIGDWMFQSKFATDTTGELLARHNVADGVYAEQVGLLILPTDLRMGPAAPDPFTSTDPQTLLNQLSTFRHNNATVSALGLAHLITGRTLDGTTVGIANINGVCDIDQGVSLTESSSESSIDGLVMAHELGHNFGAVHDGTGVCASTPQTYLMAPRINFSATLSQCSLDTIRPVIQAAKCIKPADYADVELPPAAPTINAEGDTPLVIPYVVSSTGTQTARSAVLKVTAPQNVTITAASGSNCTVAPDVVTCVLGDIPAGEQRTVNVTLTSTYFTPFTIDAHVSADNNPSTHNDDQHQPINFVLNADAKLTMTASASTVLIGDPVDFSVVVASIRSHAVQGATVTINTMMLIASASVAGGSCRIDQYQTTCTLDDIPGGSSKTITVHSTAAVVGQAQPSASVKSTVDADSSNDFAHLDVRVNAVRDVGIDEVTPNIISLFGRPFEFDAKVHSYGAQPIDNVLLGLSIQTPASATHNDAIESVTVGGVTCAPTLTGGSDYQCSVGTLAAGEVRAVVIRGHGADLGAYAFKLTVHATGDQYSNNDSLSHGVTVMHAVDVSVIKPATLTLPETQESSGSVIAVSNGSLAVSNALFDVSAPASLRFTRLYVPPDKGSCNIVTDQHFQCRLSFPDSLHGTGGTSIDYFLVGSVPGNYNLTATITAANDEVSTNDSASLPVTITPLIDVGVRDFTGPQSLMVGSDTTINATVFAGSRPVPAATAIVGVFSGAEISSITTGAGACTRVDPTRFQCDFGDLPGGASVPLSAVVHGMQAASSTQFFVNASAPADSNQSDNIRSVTFIVTDPGDLRVTASSGVAAIPGVEFAVPIILHHTGSLVGGHLLVTLPSGITLNSMSGTALMCTGISTVDCNVGDWPQDQALEVDFNLQAASAGSYTIGAKVSALNDTDDSNNEASVAVIVDVAATPPPVPPPSNPPPSGGGSSGGGGGGGSVDPALLAVLALMLLYSRRLRPSATGRRG